MLVSELLLLLEGIGIGFALAAPVGPIGVLCIRRSLHDGLLAGLVCGLGAASADAVYGAVAGFGLVSIIGLLDSYQDLVRLVGGVILCVLGVKVLFFDPERLAGANGNRRLASTYISCFLLALTNPATVFAFLAVFASIGPQLRLQGYGATAILVGGVFVGAALWWLTLSGGASLMRERFSLHGLAWVNRISGVLIVLFGIAALAAYAGWIQV
jgi:threonine/homoserine/homoserine lactone efflux protein